MTKEQAINGLKENLCSLCAYGSQNMDSCDIRECDNRDYIKALEQQPSDDEITITMKKGTLKYSGHGYVAYNKDWFKKHFATEVRIMTGYDGYNPPCDDCVSRQAVIEIINKSDVCYLRNQITMFLLKKLKDLPPVTPTQCIAEVRFSKEDLREICNERIEIECTHGTCTDCKHSIYLDSDCYRKEYYYCKKYDLKGVDISRFYCADFEKRVSENEG